MKPIAFAVLFLTAFYCHAQDVSMIKSDIFKDSKKQTALKYTLEDGNGGLVTIRAFYGGMRNRLKGYYIQYFDSNLNLIKEAEYESDDNYIRNAFIKGNQLHLIDYSRDKKEDKISFDAVSAELDQLKFSKKEIISFSERNQKKYFGSNIFSILLDDHSEFDDNHAGEVVMSTNNQFFVINFDIKNKDRETHKIFVFNNNFEKIYDHLIQKNIKDRYFDYESIDIDGTDGTVYFLGKVFENESRRSKKRGKANYHFEIFKVNSTGQTNVRFKNEDKQISSLELIKSPNRLACIGFYGKRDEDRINGVSLFNLDPQTLEIQDEKFTPFSDRFLTDKYGNREGKKDRKKRKGIKDIDFKSVYMMDNGDIILNAEEYYITRHTTRVPNGGVVTDIEYHFDDIMSLRINKGGNLIWARNINKRQTGLETSSYTSIPVGEESYFFINCSDNIKKLSADRISFKDTRAKKSNLYMIRINKNGEFDFEKLIDDKESKVYYLVKNGRINLDKQTVVFTGTRKKKSRILKIKF